MCKQRASGGLVGGEDGAAAALDAAFIVGSGLDSRVGGCFNLIGASDNRVLPWLLLLLRREDESHHELRLAECSLV